MDGFSCFLLFTGFAEDLTQGFPVDEGHSVVGFFAIFFYGEDGDDGGVGEGAGHFGLSQKTLLQRFIFFEIGADSFKGDIATAGNVLSKKNFAHAASAEAFEDRIRADGGGKGFHKK